MRHLLQVRNTEAELSMMLSASERGHISIESRQRTIDELQMELASKQLDLERILGDQVQ